MSINAISNDDPTDAVASLPYALRAQLAPHTRLQQLRLRYSVFCHHTAAAEQVHLAADGHLRPQPDDPGDRALRHWLDALADLGLCVATLLAGGDALAATPAAAARLRPADITALQRDLRGAFQDAEVAIPPDGRECIFWVGYPDGQRRCGLALVSDTPVSPVLQRALQDRFETWLDEHSAWFRPLQRLGAILLVPAET